MKTLLGLLLVSGILLSACGRITETMPRGYVEAMANPQQEIEMPRQAYLCGDGAIGAAFYHCGMNSQGNLNVTGFVNSYREETSDTNSTGAAIISAVRIIIALDIPGESYWVPQGWTDVSDISTTLGWNSAIFPFSINLTTKNFQDSGPAGILLLTESSPSVTLETMSFSLGGVVPYCGYPAQVGKHLCNEAGVGDYWRKGTRGLIWENLDPECNKTTPEAYCDVEVKTNGVVTQPSKMGDAPDKDFVHEKRTLPSTIYAPYSFTTASLVTTLDATQALAALRAKYNSGAHQYKAMYLVGRRGFFSYVQDTNWIP